MQQFTDSDKSYSTERMTQRSQQQVDTDSVNLEDIMSNPLIPAREDEQPPSERNDELPSGQSDTTTLENKAGSSQEDKF